VYDSVTVSSTCMTTVVELTHRLVMCQFYRYNNNGRTDT